MTSPISVTSPILATRLSIDYGKCRNAVCFLSSFALSSSSFKYSSSSSSSFSTLVTSVLASTTSKQNTPGNAKWRPATLYHFNGCLTFRRLNFLDTWAPKYVHNRAGQKCFKWFPSIALSGFVRILAAVMPPTPLPLSRLDQNPEHSRHTRLPQHSPISWWESQVT